MPWVLSSLPVFRSFTPLAFSRIGRKSLLGFSQKSISPLINACIAVCGSGIQISSMRSTPGIFAPAKPDGGSLRAM